MDPAVGQRSHIPQKICPTQFSLSLKYRLMGELE